MCAQGSVLCRLSSLSHVCELFINVMITLDIEACKLAMYVRTVGGHHRFKDHQANSTRGRLVLAGAQPIGNAGACALADAIKATLVVHAPSLSGFARHGLVSEALSYPDVALVTALLGERRIDRFLWLCVWPRTHVGCYFQSVAEASWAFGPLCFFCVYFLTTYRTCQKTFVVMA